MTTLKTLGHYQIVEQIGEGGMGVVYKARDTHLDRFVALKVLPPNALDDPSRKQRFIAEAKAASSLNHPNIVTIHDIDRDQGVDYIAMEYVDGKTLTQLIGRKGLPLSKALGLAIQVAGALGKAHAAGIVHRDIKPANIMVTNEGLVKILDFGLAKLLQAATPSEDAETVTDNQITDRNVILGTVAYMSPEQAEGKAVDARSDIFAFGAVLYEMLTGTAAFRRESRASTLTAVMRDNPRPINEIVEGVPRDLERIISTCLRKDPERRLQHIEDVKVTLEELKTDIESGLSGPAQAPVAATGPSRKVYWIFAGVAALLLLAAGAASVYWFLPRQPVAISDLPQTAFTFNDGVTYGPAISPDGSLAAYASDMSGENNLDIYVQQASGQQAIRLTRHEANDIMPSFSPDGSKIVYRSERDGGGIYIIDSLGGQERKIATRGWYPRFSPDGKTISVMDQAAGPSSAFGGAIFLIPAEGGSPVPFQPDFRAPYTSAGPVWSPDGRYLMFSGYNRKNAALMDWWAAPIDGSPPLATGGRKLLGRTSPLNHPLAWLPQGILFVNGSPAEGTHLYLAPITSADLKMTGPPRHLLSSSAIHSEMAASKNGRLLYSLVNWLPNYWKVDLDPDKGKTSGTLQKMTSDTSIKMDSSISRDGSRMLYINILSVQDSKVELRIRDLKGGQETRIPTSGRISGNFMARISADGSLVSYRDWDGNKWATYVARTDGSSRSQPYTACFLMKFASKAEAAYVFMENALFLLDLNSKKRTLLFEIPLERINDAVPSRDDQWVAVILDNKDRTADLGIAPLSHLPIKEADLIIVAQESRYLSSPRWSPDGNLLYYLSQRDGFLCIWAQRLDPATKRPLGDPFAVHHQHGNRTGRMGPTGLFVFEVTANALIMNLAETKANIWSANLPTAPP